MSDAVRDEYRTISTLMQSGRSAEALERLERAVLAEPRNAAWHMLHAHCLLALRRAAAARAAAARAEELAPADPLVWDGIGGLWNRAGDQQRALHAYDRAVRLAPDGVPHLFNRAAVRRFLGQFAEAESDYDRVIAMQPNFYEAYKNRADLRVQSAARNHAAEIERLLAAGPVDPRGEVELRYALAKEYEDLGEHAKSFAQLNAGARLHRSHLRYDVSTDVATADWIAAAFPSPLPGEAEAAAGDGDSPIFIVGLPRSGSTLVERMLSRHSAIVAAGELDDFALAVVRAVRRQGGAWPLPRAQLVARSAAVDFNALGQDYLAAVREAGIAAPRFTDKMPLNYLYCGLIRRALPRAKIVHVVRDPMAACYAIYKTLFKDGYPFSYDLDELGSYYLAYRRLMAHWERTLPGAIHTLRYEALITDLTGEARRLLQFCGLEWQPACTEFHLNEAPSTTASAAQVRRKLYDSSVSQWRHYEAQLAPLRERLQAAGVACGIHEQGEPNR